MNDDGFRYWCNKQWFEDHGSFSPNQGDVTWPRKHKGPTLLLCLYISCHMMCL